MRRNRAATSAFSLFAFQDIITATTGIMVFVMLILALEILNRTESPPAGGAAREFAEVQKVIGELQSELQALRETLARTESSLSDLPSLDESEIDRQIQNATEDNTRLDGDITATKSRLGKNRKRLQSLQAEAKVSKKNANEERKRLQQEVKKLTTRIQRLESGDRLFFRQGIESKRTWIVEVSGAGYRAAPIGVDQPPRKFNETQQELSPWLNTLDPSTTALFIVTKPSGLSGYLGLVDLLDKKKDTSEIRYGVYFVGKGTEVLDPVVGAGGI